MIDLTPRSPRGALRWSDAVLDLGDLLADLDTPAYIVGGAVRDALLGRPIKDIDMATSGSGTQLARTIANRLNGKYYALDAERDVGRALLDTPDGRLEIDVAKFRGDDLAADLHDRDFTINAMAVDIHAVDMLIDPLGGEADLIAKVVRRCHANAIPDDPIRALRAIRQSVQFGLRIAPDTLDDLRAAGAHLRDVSPERVRDEFFKLLSLNKVARALRVADRVDLLRYIVPLTRQLHEYEQWESALDTIETLDKIFTTISPRRTDETAASFSFGMIVMALDRYRKPLQQHIDTKYADGRSHRALLLLAALIPREGNFESDLLAEELAVALRLSNPEKQRLVKVVENRGRLRESAGSEPLILHRFWYPLGEVGVDVCLFALADYLAEAGIQLDQDDWVLFLERARVFMGAYFEQHDEIVAPAMLVDGNTLMEQLDLKPGRIIGDLLTRIREAQVMKKISTPNEALALARDYLPS
jgi:poly(A) polymerase/tRNA nucleotidyltransferase (CCA-adding enzyme)